MVRPEPQFPPCVSPEVGFWDSDSQNLSTLQLTFSEQVLHAGLWAPRDQRRSWSLESDGTQAGKDGQTIAVAVLEASPGDRGAQKFWRGPRPSRAFSVRRKWPPKLEGSVGVTRPRQKAGQNVSHQVRQCTSAVVYWVPAGLGVAVSAMGEKGVRETHSLPLPRPRPHPGQKEGAREYHTYWGRPREQTSPALDHPPIRNSVAI